MHWFWRATIAIVAGTVAGIAVYAGAAMFQAGWSADSIPFLIGVAIALFGLLVVPQMVAIRAYLAITQRYDPPRRTDETYCRKCGYILRGISQPVCPECGERL